MKHKVQHIANPILIAHNSPHAVNGPQSLLRRSVFVNPPPTKSKAGEDPPDSNNNETSMNSSIMLNMASQKQKYRLEPLSLEKVEKSPVDVVEPAEGAAHERLAAEINKTGQAEPPSSEVARRSVDAVMSIAELPSTRHHTQQ